VSSWLGGLNKFQKDVMRIPNLSQSRAALIKNSILYIIVLLMAVGLKYHYSHARSGDLGWILAPTAGMVEYLSGMAFEKEDGAGFVNRENRIIIAPSCAGVNFLIIAFCMAAFSGLCHLNSSGSKICWVGSSAAWAYGLTIAVNTLRIIGSIYLYNTDISCHGLTPERLHRIEGVFIYLFFLCLFYMALNKILHFCNRNPKNKQKKWICQYQGSIGWGYGAVIPLSWYVMISLGIPLLNRAYQKNGPQFVEHSLVILCGCMVVFLIVFLIQSLCGRIFRRIQVYRPREPNPALHGMTEINRRSAKT
jgi:exosortase K